MKSLGSKQALEIVAAFFLVRMLIYGLSIGDALAAGFIMAGILGFEVVGYLFPKRPDLFLQTEEMATTIAEQRELLVAMQSDITALKFGVAKR